MTVATAAKSPVLRVSATAMRLACALAASLLSLTAHAVVGCTLDGRPIDLHAHAATAGKKGTVHCFDGGAQPQRDVELQDGRVRTVLAWSVQPGAASGTPGARALTLQQDYRDNGMLARERRWKPNGHGADLALDQAWYPNGKLQAKSEFFMQADQPVKRWTTYHDNGNVASTGLWAIKGEHDQFTIGVHQGFDVDGHLRAETTSDARGRLTRERTLDTAGNVLHDNRVLADGSRQAFAQ